VYVSAVNATGEGKRSAFTQRTLPAGWNTDPSAPEDSQPIRIGDHGEHFVVIIVDPVEGADQYKIVDGKGNVVGIITTPETATEIGGLESAKGYDDWTVIPINDAGEGEGKPVPPFVTLPSSDFKVSVIDPTRQKLTIKVDSSLKNEIFVYASGGKELHRGKGKVFTVRDLTADQFYTFDVWTENSIHEKSELKKATGKTLEAPVSPGPGSSAQEGTKQPDPEKEKPVEGEGSNENTDDGQSGSPGFQDIDNSYAKNEILALYDKRRGSSWIREGTARL